MKNDNAYINSIKIPILSSVIAIFVCLFIVVAILFIQSPDLINARFSLYGDSKPIAILAPSSGELHILHTDSPIKIGTTLAFIDSHECYYDINFLDSIIEYNNTVAEVGEKVRSLSHKNLGDISDYFVNFISSYDEYYQYILKKSTDIEIEGYTDYLTSLKSILKGTEDKINIENKILGINNNAFFLDSALYFDRAVNIQDYQNSNSNYLKSIESILNTKIETRRILCSIQDIQNKLSLAKAIKEEEITKLYNNVYLSLYRLRSSIKEWKSKHLISIDSPGILENPLNLFNGQYVTEGTEIFRVIPNIPVNSCKIFFSNINSSKITRGAYVKLYPDNHDRREHGYLIGYIQKIDKSLISLDSSSTNLGYSADVSIDMKCQPFFKGDKHFINGTVGSAEIIYKNKCLFGELTQWISNNIN